MKAVAVAKKGHPREVERRGPAWRFWLSWVLASAIAVPVGSTLGGLAGEAAHGVIFETMGFAVVGLVVGLGQWLALGRHVPQTGWYVLATMGGYSLVGLAAGTMGWVFGGETGWGLVGAKNVAVRYAVGGTVAGIVVGTWLGTVDGVLQWVSLRRHVSGWFVLASAVGEGMGGAMSFTVAAAMGVVAGDILRAAMAFVVGGATGGAVVGGLLVLLFSGNGGLAMERVGHARLGSRVKRAMALPASLLRSTETPLTSAVVDHGQGRSAARP